MLFYRTCLIIISTTSLCFALLIGGNVVSSSEGVHNKTYYSGSKNKSSKSDSLNKKSPPLSSQTNTNKSKKIQPNEVEILPYQSSGYKYKIIDNNAEPPTGYEQPEFDDSSWNQGTAAFGFSQNFCPFQSTVKTPWELETQLLVRRSISVPSGANNLQVKVMIDNDILGVFFNGVEIANSGSNIPDCPLFDHHSIPVPQNLVVPGTNYVTYRLLDRGFESFFDTRIIAENITCGLGNIWNQTENGLNGVWTRRGTSNVFDAVWTNSGGGQVTAVLTIDLNGNNVSIARRQSSDGNDCDYVGTIDKDGITVQGTYTCTLFPPPNPNWQATIDCGDNPVINNINPSVGEQSSTTFVTTGSNFTSGGNVKLNLIDSKGNIQEVDSKTANSSGQVTAYFTTSCSIAPGDYTLQLKDVATNVLSNSASISVTESPGCFLSQTITNIDPKTVVLNTPTTLKVYGNGFIPAFVASVITPEGTFNIDSSETTFISPQEVHVNVNMGGTSGYNATLRIDSIRDRATRSFTVVAPTSAPTISNVTSPVIANQVAHLTVDGSNFQQNFKAFITTPDGTFELLSGNKNYVNSNQVKLDVVMRGSPPYNATVKIENPGGQFANGTFQVNPQSQPPSTMLEVIGLEVTQAVQDLGNNANSVPLIQGKRTYVRVHTKSKLNSDIPNVRGKLLVTRVSPGPIESLGELETIERTVKVDPSRTSLADSFLFLLPSTWTTGRIQIKFEGVSHNFEYNKVNGTNDGRLEVEFEDTPQLTIRIINVYWKNFRGIVFEPSPQEIIEAKLELVRMLPTKKIVFKEGWLESPSQPERSEEFFTNLNYLLTQKRLTDCRLRQAVCDEYYLGIISQDALQTLPTAGPVGKAEIPMLECPREFQGNVASAIRFSRNERVRFNEVHELGHLFGRHHTDYVGSRESGTCTHFPTDGTIGGIETDEYASNAIFGFDGQNTFNTSTPDVMSYGNYSYVSGFTYRAILTHIRNKFSSQLKNLNKSKLIVEQGSNISIISGRITEDLQNGELSAIYSFPLPINIPINTTGSYEVRFFDANNKEIESYPFYPNFGSEGNIGSFVLLLPQHLNATRISLNKNGQELASKQASANPPLVTVTSPNGGETLDTSTVNLQWTASDADGDDLQYLVQYSSNVGATWETLASDLDETSYEVRLDSIAGTNQGLFRVIATDGFYSSLDQSDNYFSVNSHAPQVSISNPINNSYFVGDQNISLSGSAFDLEDGEINDNSLLWTSDLEGSLGAGKNLSINAVTLQEGTHNITLTARDSSNQTGTTNITIQVYRTQPTIPTTLSAAPNNLSFIAQEGTTNLSSSQTLAIRNDGEGTLNWTASADQPWIQLGDTTGTAPSNAEIRINPGGLALGNHSGTITITTPDAANSPQTVNVNLTIVDYPVSLSKPIFDFDGDGKTDIGIFRPNVGEWWYLRSSDLDNRALQFGSSTDVPTPADFTGDGKTDISFFRNGEWFVLRSEDDSFFSFPWGQSGDIPAPGDYDGDGKADPAVFRPTDTNWYILKSTGEVDIIPFGIAEDKPVIADYDGDGKDDIAVYRPSVSEWWINRSQDGVSALQFGSNGDRTVQGDYTGDGKADVSFFRPTTGEWFIIRSEDFSFFSFPWGTNGDIPAPGDYDGDGVMDATVFRPNNTTWFSNTTSNGVQIVGFGSNGDIPVPSVYSVP